MSSETVLALVGAFGIGTMITTVVQHFLNARSGAAERLYVELRESFTGLLQSISEWDRVNDPEEQPAPGDRARAHASFNYWAARMRLVASDDVMALVDSWWDGDDEDEMNRTIGDLQDLMRQQLRAARG